jgi:hypothetical protein
MVGVAHAALGAIGAVVARFVHTEEVTGSNPVSPTHSKALLTRKNTSRERFSFQPVTIRMRFRFASDSPHRSALVRVVSAPQGLDGIGVRRCPSIPPHP